MRKGQEVSFRRLHGHRKKHGRMQPDRRVDFRRPSWTSYYWLGVEASKSLTPHKSYVEIAQATGLTKQNAFTACMLALGKVVFELRRLA